MVGIYNDFTKTISDTVSFSGLTANATAAHFHAPAPPGSNAAVIISFTGFPFATSGTYFGSSVVTLTQETQLFAGLWYANIHTSNFPGGEIRGQVTLGAALPISLTGLQGKLNNNLTISLNWSTTSEYNNKGFFIERNETDNITSWISLGFVNGTGNSSVKKDYSLIDNNIQFNKIYRYRLKQVDFDGNFTYSNEVLIRVKDLQKNTLLLTSSPNPFKSTATLKYNIPSSGMVSLKIFSVSGNEVTTLINRYQQSGIYLTSFNADKLGNGIYLCRLFFEGQTITNRIILSK